ncbi:MAG: cytochrome C oxidase subunit IV family protein [Gemmatimonadetes bacterium]|nr:cytochrome C oxidase subunit IV family protein [Gemmatimonadota bacterium]
MNQVRSKTSGHPSSGTYLTIAAILTIITLLEVGIFYVELFRPVLAPVLLVLSAVKFSLVVMFYMHLKGDHKLFTLVFVGPLLIATGVLVALLLLFGVFVVG